jgi:hypothetical protein
VTFPLGDVCSSGQSGRRAFSPQGLTLDPERTLHHIAPSVSGLEVFAVPGTALQFKYASKIYHNFYYNWDL